MSHLLDQKISRISEIFDISDIARTGINSSYIKQYYAVNKIPYSIFHNLGNSVHMGISRDGSFKSEDLMEQARFVGKYIESEKAFRVLEVGAGRGANSVWLARKFPDVAFVALDFSDEQMSFARQSGRNLPNLSLLLGDFHDLAGIATASLDIVFAVECVCHSSQTDRVLASVLRALKPGGKFILFDGYRERPRANLSSDEDVGAVLVERGMAVERFYQYTDLKALAREMGFVLEFEEDLSLLVLPTMHRFEQLAKLYFRHRRPARVLARALPSKFTYNAISGWLMPTLIADKIFSYWCTVLTKPTS